MAAATGAPGEVNDDFGAVWEALGDPTRRRTFLLLVQGGPATATELQPQLGVARQVVSHHLRRLTEAGLVRRSRQGRSVRYAPVAARWRAAARWLGQLSPARAPRRRGDAR